MNISLNSCIWGIRAHFYPTVKKLFYICVPLLLLFGIFVFYPDAENSLNPADHRFSSPKEEKVGDAFAVSAQKKSEVQVLNLKDGSTPSIPSLAFRVEGVNLILALDEAMIRGEDGKERLVELTPPATRDTLMARLASLGKGEAVLPIAYLEGRAFSESTRRLLTADIRVQADETEASELVSQNNLAVKQRPDYAPEWVILRAPNPLAALEAVLVMRTAGFSTADPLLAKQWKRRTAPNDPLYSQQWHLNNSDASRTHINVESVWGYGASGGIRGNGINISIVDDGLETGHPDFVGNINTDLDFDWNGNDSDPEPSPSDNHGTACAGVAAARGNNNLGVSGVAPEAGLVGLRLIAASVTDAEEGEAMTWENDEIFISSNSWGPDDAGDLLTAPGALTLAAFESGVTNGRGGLGTIFVWAGGNGRDADDNSNYDGYSNSIYTIAVGAMDDAGGPAWYSEPGANVVVVAPSDGGSEGITTTDLTGSAGSSSNDYANDFGGTSSATPKVSGVVALMLEANPQLGWRDVQEVLIRSAYQINPGSSGWSTNSAGLTFHHDFGSGLVDASAAVSLAQIWSPVPVGESTTVTRDNLSSSIPENTATGVELTFTPSGDEITVEHATLLVDIDHTSRGNLEIVLISPSGMESRLAESRTDSNSNYDEWTFSTVRHWGEGSSGNWTLKVADRSGSGNSSGGTLRKAVLTLHGRKTTPLIRITNPSEGEEFSPGSTVQVDVESENIDATTDPGPIVRVELLEDGNLLLTDTSSPFSFQFTAEAGTFSLVARAYDADGDVLSSAPVQISVENQAPVVIAASLTPSDPAYADSGLLLTGVVATDPENDELSFSYQWQSSTDGVLFTDVIAETAAYLTGGDARAGLGWSCVVTASDSSKSSEPFTTNPVTLITRPETTAVRGASYSYQSDLVIKGTETVLERTAIINEFSQGPAGGSSEWIEILMLKEGTLAYWDFQDEAGNIVVFQNSAVWDDLPAGTLIVIYNGGSTKDSLLPADDVNSSDGVMVVSSSNSTYFDEGFDVWPPLGNSGDSLFLYNIDSEEVQAFSYGNSSQTALNVGDIGSGDSASFTGKNEAELEQAEFWSQRSSTVSGTTGVTPGNSNGGDNDSFVTALRNGTLNFPPAFRLGAEVTLPVGLTLSTETGLLSGTISSGAALGAYPIVIERENGDAVIVSQSFTIQVSNPPPIFVDWIEGFSGLGAQKGRGEDPDADGIPNALENWFGTIPGDVEKIFDYLELQGQAITFSHPLAVAPASDVMASYLWSTDLNNWQGSGEAYEGKMVLFTTEPAAQSGWLNVTATMSSNDIEPIFIRIRVE